MAKTRRAGRRNQFRNFFAGCTNPLSRTYPLRYPPRIVEPARIIGITRIACHRERGDSPRVAPENHVRSNSVKTTVERRTLEFARPPGFLHKRFGTRYKS